MCTNMIVFFIFDITYYINIESLNLVMNVCVVVWQMIQKIYLEIFFCSNWCPSSQELKSTEAI